MTMTTDTTDTAAHAEKAMRHYERLLAGGWLTEDEAQRARAAWLAARWVWVGAMRQEQEQAA